MSDADLTSLARALVFLAQEFERPCEESHAIRLLAEVARSHPGEISEHWWSWLLSAGRSLGLELHVSDIPARDLPVLLKSGACIVAERNGLVRRKINVASRDSRRLFLVESTPSLIDEDSVQENDANPIRVISLVPASMEISHGAHQKPLVMLWKLLAPDQRDIWALVVISGAVGLLMLSVPVAAQQLVRNVTFVTLYQPIVVLSLLLLGLLGFVAALQALQVYVAEIIQRRLFLRITSQISHRLIRADTAVWRHHSIEELVNRFLEVAIVQKVAAALLVDGITIVLTTVIGMSVMAFYHPFLLGYDAILVLLLTATLFGFGPAGVKTAIEESRAKYHVLSWLEDMARCPGLFRTGGIERFAMQRTDTLCDIYMRRRGSHFSILIRQIILILILQAMATTTLLGLGGFLVLNEQLTLGQLVAAELIVTMIIASFAKLGKHLEGWYDLLASVDKLSHLFDLPSESNDGLIGLTCHGPAKFRMESQASTTSESTGSMTNNSDPADVAAGESAVLLNWNRSLTTDIAERLRGLRLQTGPALYLDRHQIDDIRPDILRHHVAVVSDLEFLPAEIGENIHLSRPNVLESDISQVCDATGLASQLRDGGLNLSTYLLPNGWPLNPEQQVRLVLARALAGRPRLLFVDHHLDCFDHADFLQLWRHLSHYQSNTTIVIATARADIAQTVGRVIAEFQDRH